MACPYLSQQRRLQKINEEDRNPSNGDDDKSICYGDYLMLSQVLNAQRPQSGKGNAEPIHDEHFFIVIHQAFELWFKQILYELNSVRQIFDTHCVKESQMLVVISRLHRIDEILKLLTSQFQLLNTMTPQDFLDFRSFLLSSSGFESLQFRLLEIRLGVREDLRIQYNEQNYLLVLPKDQQEMLEKALAEKSLLDVVSQWLERTPGLKKSPNGFDFFNKLQINVTAMLAETEEHLKEIKDPEVKARKIHEHQQYANSFDSIFDETIHANMLKRGSRRLSHRALQGALMITMYRDEPRIHLPFQLLQCLTDIDDSMTKLRYSHACVIQRIIGSKAGTGGSSGYHYVRSTCSDRYKVFLDLVNMSTFLVPRNRIPPLTEEMQRSFSIHDLNSDLEIDT